MIRWLFLLGVGLSVVGGAGGCSTGPEAVVVPVDHPANEAAAVSAEIPASVP